MPTPDGPTDTCLECSGTGEIEGEFHVFCLGTGKVSTSALFDFLKQFNDDTMDKLSDIKEKVDEIKDIVDAL